MQSLETALRYNPNSLELMTSLAEVYVRLGRFDKRTMELCEKVLSQHVENAMLQQAHSIGMLIDQAEALEQNQAQGRGLPEAETLETSLTILDEFLAQSEQCIEGWVAWTRLQIMMCQLERAADGIRRLKALGFTELARTFKPSLDLALERKDMEEEDSQRMAGLFQLIRRDDLDGGTVRGALRPGQYDRGADAAGLLHEALHARPAARSARERAQPVLPADAWTTATTIIRGSGCARHRCWDGRSTNTPRPMRARCWRRAIWTRRSRSCSGCRLRSRCAKCSTRWRTATKSRTKWTRRWRCCAT